MATIINDKGITNFKKVGKDKYLSVDPAEISEEDALSNFLDEIIIKLLREEQSKKC